MIITKRLPGIIYVNRYTFYSVVALLLTLIYLLFKWNLLCTDIQAWHHVHKMCTLYKSGLAVGTLCRPICDTQEIASLKCHVFSTTEADFSAEWHKTKMVFKVASTDVQALHWHDNGVLKYPTEKEFVSIIRGLARSKLNVTLSVNIIKLLSKLNSANKETVLEKRHKEMSNLWVLLLDNEYLRTTVYAERDVFPQLIGTCGPYFAVEHLEPVPDIPAFPTLNEGWAERLRTAILIMELLDELDTGFAEPLHLCDVKLHHFGFAKDGTRLKYLDLSNVHPRSVVDSLISRIDRCSTDEECEVGDCRGRCDEGRGSCRAAVTNCNLQTVCEKIFLGWRMSGRVMVPGLLMSQRTPAELAAVMRQCADPRRTAPDEEIRRRLYNILVEMEQATENDFPL